MSLIIPKDILRKTKSVEFQKIRDSLGEKDRFEERTPAVHLDAHLFSAEALTELSESCKEAGSTKQARAIAAITAARSGRGDIVVPSFQAFEGMLKASLREKVIDGWLYKREQDGNLYPYLVTDISFESDRYDLDENPLVKVQLVAFGIKGDNENKIGISNNAIHIRPAEVAKKRVSMVLENRGYFIETPELKARHLASLDAYKKNILGKFAEQFRMTGTPLMEVEGRRYREVERVENRKVVNDLEVEENFVADRFVESILMDKSGGVPTGKKSRSSSRDEGEQEDGGGLGLVPVHPVTRVFDLKTHLFFWAHADILTPYVYDASLRDKLVLPESHRELLDVLTSDVTAFVDDFIEGKSAGNVILCKGKPGLGKTLTAECYAELIKRPLYMVHTGTMGTDADSVQANLQKVFNRVKRWNAVALLDEADIFVMERGTSLQQNAIVAVFLRSLEYFDGLMFMTTNRGDMVDEAILHRFAAIIQYNLPSREDTRKIWGVLATQFGVTLAPELVTDLLDTFPEIAPRDIKMLLRRTLRLSAARGEDLDLEAFGRSAMFQDLKIVVKKDEVAA